jgi:hypothetical protein
MVPLVPLVSPEIRGPQAKLVPLVYKGYLEYSLE